MEIHTRGSWEKTSLQRIKFKKKYFCSSCLWTCIFFNLISIYQKKTYHSSFNFYYDFLWIFYKITKVKKLKDYFFVKQI